MSVYLGLSAVTCVCVCVCACVCVCVCVCACAPLPSLRHTHELKLHQLLVRVAGWEQVKPVSVDKVGVFFRYAAPDRNNPSNTVSTPQGGRHEGRAGGRAGGQSLVVRAASPNGVAPTANL